MPKEKDERLWMRFPIAFDEDPAIDPLSDAAFRAFIEMNGYSRRNDLDGVIPRRVAVKRWGSEVLQEIADARPDSPFFVIENDVCVLTKYDRHQYTTSARAKRSETNRVNGSLGGQARAKRLASESLSEPQAEIEIETEATSKEVAARKRGSRVPRDFAITPEMRAWATAEAPLVDLDKKLGEWIDYWSGVAGERGVKVDWIGTWRNGMRKQQEFAVKDGLKPPRKMQTVADLEATRRKMREEPRG